MRSVLLIEDDLELLRQMAVAFNTAGYKVHAAPDGLAGLSLFAAAAPDLVITDIIMPNREGIETIVALKNANPHVKVIAISGGYRVGPADFLHLARHVGADSVLAKPFRPSQLVALAAQLLTANAPAVAA